MSDAEIIDWEQLSMIFGDEEDLDEDMTDLFQEFLEDATQRFDLLKRSSFEDQKELIAKEAHKMKGSASNFGYTKVASFLANIENNISGISEEEYRQSLDGASNAFESSTAQVLMRFPALQPS